MKENIPQYLFHKVVAIPNEWRVESILLNGLIPQVADAYKDLVPENIRDKPVVWFFENYTASDGIPCFEVDTKGLDPDRLRHVAIAYGVDKELKWWIYQGEVPSSALRLVSVEPLLK